MILLMASLLAPLMSGAAGSPCAEIKQLRKDLALRQAEQKEKVFKKHEADAAVSQATDNLLKELKSSEIKPGAADSVCQEAAKRAAGGSRAGCEKKLPLYKAAVQKADTLADQVDDLEDVVNDLKFQISDLAENSKGARCDP